MGGIISALMMMRQAFVLHKAIYAAFRYTIADWNPNDLAIVFAVGLPLALYLALDQSLHASRVQVWTAWLYLPLASIAILLTGSRSGLVNGVVALGAIPFLLSRSSRTRIYALLAIFASILCVVMILIPAGTWHILSTVGVQMQSGDLDKRVKVWRFGWQAFLESPLFGSGVRSFRWASRTLYNAHNTYLEVSVEQGVAGFFLFLGLILSSFARLKRATGPGRVAGTLPSPYLGYSSYRSTTPQSCESHGSCSLWLSSWLAITLRTTWSFSCSQWINECGFTSR